MAALNHPNISAIYGIEESDGVHALVLELVDGPTLADRIAQGPVPLDESLPLAQQVAAALEAAHEHGIVHRDLKPANIKVLDDGTVKVLDFGLAKLTQSSGSGPQASEMTASPTLSLAATHVGVILGTAPYMAPEQARGKAVDKRADIWAFGCAKSSRGVSKKDARKRFRDVGDVAYELARRQRRALRAARVSRLRARQRAVRAAVRSQSRRGVWRAGSGTRRPPAGARRLVRRAAPLVATTFFEHSADLSADGRWMAYQSNESGRDEVYVRPFPDVNGGRWQVSTGGGTAPRWAPNSRELFYVDAEGRIVAVLVQPSPGFVAGNPHVVVDGSFATSIPGFVGRMYDVSRDGQRFLVLKGVEGAEQEAPPPQIVVITNWFEELRRLVPK